MGLALYLLYEGYVFGDRPITNVRAAATAVTVLVVVALSRLHALRRRPGVPANPAPGHNVPNASSQQVAADATNHSAISGATLGDLANLVGIVALTFAGIGVIAGASPTQASSKACPGVPIRGGSFQIVTPEDGITTRSGPSILAPQTGRLDGSCSVRIDGYCYGSPIDDVTDESRFDSRWFRIYRIDGALAPVSHFVSGGAEEPRFLAGGALTSQVSDEVVKHLTGEGECGAGAADWASEAPAPGSPTLEPILAAEAENTGSVYFKVTAQNTYDLGFALQVLGSTTTGDPFRRIPVLVETDEQGGRPSQDESAVLPKTALKSVNDNTRVAQWIYGSTARYLVEPTVVVVAGVGCLGINAPAQTQLPKSALRYYELSPGGELANLIGVPEYVTEVDEEGLARVACREASP